MNTEELNAVHRNPDNWHLAFFYFAPEDPRIVVKRRIGVGGWTLNLARPLAIPFLIALIAGTCGYVELLARFELPETGKWIGVALLFVMIVSLCGWMSNPRRHAAPADFNRRP